MQLTKDWAKIIYGTIIFIVLHTFLGKAIRSFVGLFVQPAPLEGAAGVITPLEVGSSLLVTVLTLLFSFAGVFVFLNKIEISQLNQFLKPTNFKIIFTVIAFMALFFLAYFTNANVIAVPELILNILSFFSTYFGGIFGFMEFGFPILVYYVIASVIAERYLQP